MTPEQIEIRRERAAAWNKANPDRKRRAAKLWYLKNRKAAKKAAVRWRKEHRQQAAEIRRAWHEKYPWYDCWQGARQRCNNPKTPRYHRYGGRGIKMLLSKADVAFMWVRDNAASMREASIDRYDNDWDYVLENCRFISKSDNSRKGGLARGELVRA